MAHPAVPARTGQPTSTFLPLVACLVLAGCAPGASPSPGVTPSPGETASPGVSPSPPPGGQIDLTYDFRDGEQGWQALFSDYTEQVPPGDPVAGIEELPPGSPDEAEGPGFLLAATNHPDDVFMFLKRSIGPDEGVEPDSAYRVSFRITFLSDAPTDCAGIGGAPGESVTMKAGATSEEPQVVEENGSFVLNVDKGNQSADGPAATAVGNVANGIPCEEALEQEPRPLAQVTHEQTHDRAVESDEDGRLWLLVGTDSGFEGRTTIVYQSIEVTLAQEDEDG